MKRLTLLVLVLSALSATHANAQGVLLFRNARVFDGTAVITATDVLVRDGIIVRVAKGITAPAGATIIEAGGKTLLPGLIDSHTHAFGTALRDAAIFGVTTELDMFTDPTSARQMRAQQAEGKANDRADLFSAGTLVTAPGGHGTEYGFAIPTITSPDSAQAFVDARIAEGSDYIKLVYDDGSLFARPWPTLSRATLRALIDAAHKRGKLAVVHISRESAARAAIEEGADALVHLFTDVAPPADFSALVRARGAFIVPTLVVLKSISGVGGAAPLADDARFRPYLTSQSIALLKQGFPVMPGSPSKDFNHALATVAQLKRAGVPILAGTDAPNPGTAHGAAMHRELELLVQAGLTPVEALAAATSVPARAFKLSDRGRIAAGLRADLLLVDGDPTTNITATRAIAGIWKAGHAIDRSVLQREVVAAEASANASVDGLASGLISDFEKSSMAPVFGTPWMVSTDQFAGGESTGNASVVDGGANGSAKALSVSGEIKAKFAYPWSGVMWSPRSQPMQPGDLSSKKEISFWTKGDGGTYRVMVFAQSTGMQPVAVDFVSSPEWREVVVPWSALKLDGKGVMAIVFTGGPKVGTFNFTIDDVRLR